jgi:adenine-specific DNA methylase
LTNLKSLVCKMPTYPKRLIEVDLPIKKISAHARREKSIRHGHISTLHIWWARRPLAACRAVTCAALWIDPVDELCPDVFRERAAELITAFARKAATDKDLVKGCDTETWQKWRVLAEPKNALDMAKPEHRNILRYRLLDFIADFANWDNSTQPDYLATSRGLTKAAHEALGGMPGTRPLVVDPFAGGGAIPLEALRVGADAFASDLNPVAVLLNKVVLEYIPKYGQRLADEVRKWGEWIKEEAEKELGQFYPKDEDGSTPIAYMWARTIISEAPDDGSGIPVEVPLMRSLWLGKKPKRLRALRWVRDSAGIVQTETVEVTYADGVTRTVRRPLLEIFEPQKVKEVEDGTVARGSATCPVTGFTTPVASVRAQLKPRKGGADDARLFCVVTTKASEKGRFYRLPNARDLAAIKRAKVELEKRKKEHQGELSLVPEEPLPPQGSLGFRVQLYGMEEWGNLFTFRQALALTTLVRLVQEVGQKLVSEDDQSLAIAVQSCLSLNIGKLTDYNSSLSRWLPQASQETVGSTFSRQALPIVWDFAEAYPLVNSSGGWSHSLDYLIKPLEQESLAFIKTQAGQVVKNSAINHALPDDSIQAFISDPPYYDAVPYSDLSDFFYVWLKRSLYNSSTELFNDFLTPKQEECIVDEVKGKDKAYFEKTMGQAMREGWRILAPNGIGLIVFAHKSTSGWEAQLQAMVEAGWTVTGSWAIDTERGNRLRAMNSAALASSVHLVCRPRTTNEIGDWREILTELPQRIHDWMPRLASEGVVGADAIFACLGPALEIYSRYASVERANGEEVTLREYLEYVWATVSKEALSMIFDNATATDLEEDARLTAMWLWTLSTDTTASDDDSNLEADDDEESSGKSSKLTGFSLEYDAARKIAQGLGAYLEKLTSLVEIKGSNARLLPVAERAIYLFGKEGLQEPKPKAKRSKSKQLTLDFGDVINQLTEEQGTQEITVTQVGKTVLDRIHQTMLLFAAGRSDAMSRFLVEDGIGADQRFWTLAQSLSALYPLGTDEKRWIDGVLARKKGLGF